MLKTAVASDASLPAGIWSEAHWVWKYHETELDFQDPGTGAHIGIHFIQGPITGSEEKWVLAELSGLLEIPPAKEINAASKRIPPTDCTHRLTEQLQM